MDYEKKYNEALERARKIHDEIVNNEVLGFPGQITDIFPELRESESESESERMIRKIEMFLSAYGADYFSNEEWSEIENWLEKQKSNNSDEIINFKFSVGDVVCRKGCADHTIKELFIGKEPVYICTNDEGLESHIPYSEQDEWELKQKEQKPNIEICPHSVKSKSYSETGYPIEDCDYGLEIALNILEKTLGKVYGFQTDDGIREHQTAIKAVKDAMKEQKPAWGEEDKTIINVLRLAVVNSGEALFRKHEITKQECIDFVNSLRPSWKPSDEEIEEMVNERATKSGTTKSEMAFYRNGIKDAIKRFNLRPKPKQEWSKEDEKIISEACCSINEYAKSIKKLHFTKSLELLRLCEKLKDIGSPFKPSEQEKGALRTAIHILTDERNFPKAATQLQNILNAFEGKESRKDWKPSEEQMGALSWMLENARANIDFDPLKDLYEQLKKL